MPDPVIQGAARQESYIRLYHRAAWGDPWEYEPRAKVTRASRFLAPRIGECDFLVYFNDWLLQPGETEPQAYFPISFVGHFIKVTSQKEGQPENRDWTGIVMDDAVSYKSNVALRGVQRVKALSLEFLLYRRIIHRALVYHAGKTSEIDWAPSFNLRDQLDRGERQIDPTSRDLLGNSHGTLDRFGQDVRWDAWKALQYLIDNYGPGDGSIPWTLTGQHESLEQWEDIWHQDQLSLGAIFDSLVSRKTGYTWYVNCYDVGELEFVDIRIQTMFGSDFTVGTKTIPANDRQASYTIPVTSPERHIFGSPEFHYSATEQYRNIIVQGNRIKMLGTWSVRDETLTSGWTFIQEQEYRDCTAVPLVEVTDPITGIVHTVPDVHACDSYRTKDIFQRVFSAFVVINPWDGLLGDGTGNPKLVAIPVPGDDGTVEFTADPDDKVKFYQLEKRFLPYIPLLEGLDYSRAEDHPLFDQRFGTDTDYRKLMVLFQEPYTGQYARGEHISEKQAYLHPITAVPLKKEFGIEVRCSPAHIIAGASPYINIPFSRRGIAFHNPVNSQYDNELAWTRMIVTGFVEMDQRPRHVIVGDQTLLNDLVITVKSCEYWYVMPNTVVDVDHTEVDVDDSNTNLVYVHPDFAVPNALRQDLDILETVAAVAKEWFSVPRQKIQLPVNDVGYGTSITPQLGVYLTGIDGLLVSEEVNSIVSGVSFNYREGTSMIETDFFSLSSRLDLSEVLHQMQRGDQRFAQLAKIASFVSSE